MGLAAAGVTFVFPIEELQLQVIVPLNIEVKHPTLWLDLRKEGLVDILPALLGARRIGD